MSSLNVRLNEDDNQKLEQILNATGYEKSELVRKLITDQWVALQIGKTFVERRGGHPKHLLQGPSDLSSRQKRKSVIAEQYDERAKRRTKRS